MTTVETKVELVTEAIEALVLANVAHATQTSMNARKANYQNVVDARAVLARAFKELMTPTLRVLNGPGRTLVEHVPYGGEGIDGMNLA